MKKVSPILVTPNDYGTADTCVTGTLRKPSFKKIQRHKGATNDNIADQRGPRNMRY